MENFENLIFQLQKIFDPYFTTKKTGNGLGLATSYSIVKKHYGFIAADSQVGEGKGLIKGVKKL